MSTEKNSNESSPAEDMEEPEDIAEEVAEINSDDSTSNLTDEAEDIPSHVPMIALIFIFIADYFIFRGSAGIGYASFFWLMVLILPKNSSNRKYVVTCCIISVFCLRNFWQSTDLTPYMGFLMLFILGSVLAQNSLHVMEMIRSYVVSCFHSPFIANDVAKKIVKLPIFRFVSFEKTLVYTVPFAVLVVFITIFSLANPVVSNLMSSCGDWLAQYFGSLTDWIPSFSRILFWLFSLCAIVVVLLPEKVISETRSESISSDKEIDDNDEEFNRNFFIARNTLISVNILFLLYNCIDAIYLFGQRSLPEGIAFSDYARGGTFWLTVALAFTSLVLGIIFSGGLNFHRSSPQLKNLTWLWAAQNFAIALFTFRRLFLYIDYNGLTRMRILGAMGIILVIIGLIIVVYKIKDQKSFLWMVRRQMIAFVLALFVLHIFPRDYLISAVNVPRILAAGKNNEEKMRPATLLARHPISAEGIPGLIPLLESKNGIIRKGVAGILMKKLKQIRSYQHNHPRWTQGEFSRSWALKHLQAIEPKLQKIIPDGHYEKRINKLKNYTAKWW